MRFLLFSLFLLNVSNVAGQSNLAREHLSVLTSDSLAGRGFTRSGQEKAANYIIQKLKSFKLEAGNKGDFEQGLSYPVNTFPGSAQFSVENNNAIKIYRAGKDFLFHSASATLEINGEIQPITYDFTFPAKYKNHIFYLEKSEANRQQIEDLTQNFLFKSKIKGNLLIIQDSSKWSWFPSSQQGDNAVIYIKDKLTAGTKVNVINESKFISDFQSSNVIGKIPGERSDSVIMFSAHYDHIGEMGNAIFPGANDNSSGVALLLTLAKYYGKNQPKFDTYFLFTTAEEIGLLGSYHFIKNSPFDLKKIKMLINFDMVGTGEEGITVVNAKKHDRFYDLLNRLNKNRIAEIKARGEACNSDHCLFDRMGVPAIFIYTLGGKQAYHDIYDNGENLSFEAFDNLHDLIIESLDSY